jgi:hypothetical protein
MQYTQFQKFQIWVIKLLAKVKWNQRALLTEDDDEELKEKFAKDYYIIATRKSNYLTTFFICLSNFFLTGKWGFYSHVLMNLEDTVKSVDDFRFIEATGAGVHYSTFEEVYGHVDAVALIKPKHMTIEEWTTALDSAKIYLGRPYDNLFDLKSSLEINCVELIRLALQGIPDYNTKFANFEKMIASKKKLTPDMFHQCDDFEVVYTINR